MVALAQMVTLGMDARLFIMWTGPNHMEPRQRKRTTVKFKKKKIGNKTSEGSGLQENILLF